MLRSTGEETGSFCYIGNHGRVIAVESVNSELLVSCHRLGWRLGEVPALVPIA